MSKLTEKQKAFADYYIESLNATESYKKAYKTDNSRLAEVNGSKLLRNTKVKAYIDEIMEFLSGERIANAEEVLELLTEMARGLTTEQQVVIESTGDFISEAKIIEKRISEKDRLKACELIGKRYRLFTDKVEAKVQAQVVFGGEDELDD